jgi:hypothetical protein
MEEGWPAWVAMTDGKAARIEAEIAQKERELESLRAAIEAEVGDEWVLDEDEAEAVV